MDKIRNTVRSLIGRLAALMDRASGGRITPNQITLIGLAAHFYIAYLIGADSLQWAALLLIIFGLFDTLDGELARHQKRASASGMLLDASTDRIKEVILYTGAAYALIGGPEPFAAVWAVAACGASLTVSYVKAKGESAVKDSGLTPNEINRLFQDGIARFEVRMAILIVGLLLSQLAWAVAIVAVIASFTAIGRLFRITKKLA